MMAAHAPRETIERAGELLATGLSQLAVSRMTGLATETIRAHFPGSGHVPNQRKYNDTHRARVRSMLDDGCSYIEITRSTGISQGTIATWFPGEGWTKDQCSDLRRAVRDFVGGTSAAPESRGGRRERVAAREERLARSPIPLIPSRTESPAPR